MCICEMLVYMMFLEGWEECYGVVVVLCEVLCY